MTVTLASSALRADDLFVSDADDLWIESLPDGVSAGCCWGSASCFSSAGTFGSCASSASTSASASTSC